MASFFDSTDNRYGGMIVEGVSKKKRIRTRNPLEPLFTFNWMLLSMLLIGIGWGLIGALTGHGGGIILGFGRTSVCVDAGAEGTEAKGMSWLFTPHPGVRAYNTGFHLCTDTPTTGQRWWSSLEQFPRDATLFVVALTIFFTLQQAHLRGLYTRGFAAKLRFLGWFLVVESIVQEPIEDFAGGKLWHTMADGPFSRTWNVVWVGLLAGVALLSLARIMRVGTAMREDLEGVV